MSFFRVNIGEIFQFANDGRMPDFLPKTPATEAEAGHLKKIGSGRSIRRQVDPCKKQGQTHFDSGHFYLYILTQISFRPMTVWLHSSEI